MDTKESYQNASGVRPAEQTGGRSMSAAGESNSSTSETSTDEQDQSRPAPPLFHKVINEKSVLTLVVAEGKLFAGTQGGEILVWSMETFQQLAGIRAHRGAVLSLALSGSTTGEEDRGCRDNLLLSSAGDAIVNVWNPHSLRRIYSIYSFYDVGDVFCTVYSSSLKTIYLGAQNTSIQWYDLSRKDARPAPDLSLHPSQRVHRFFDSKGPGGISTPRSTDGFGGIEQGGQILDISKSDIVQYAHFGYVYCMLLGRSLKPRDFGNDMLISGGGDGSIKLWRLDKTNGGAIQQTDCLENGDDSILSLALNDTLLYAGRLEGQVNVWDLDTRQLIQVLKTHDEDVLTVAIGCEYLFAGSADGHVTVFEHNKSKAHWKAHDGLILASTVAKHRKRPYLVTGGNDNSISIWDLSRFYDVPRAGSNAANERMVQSLGQFIAYRTVSSDPSYAEDCRRGASWLRTLLSGFGANVEMLNTQENVNPVVFARFKGKSPHGKRILFYGHYDVFAAESEHSKWKTDPFVMHGREGYLYGRGVSDNKGPILAAIYAVADLFAAKELETDIAFLIEGEEECGSRAFETIVKDNKSVIGPVDWILLANSYWLTDDFPCLTYGLRGNVHATLNIKGGKRDLHSGVNGSHLMNEPLKDLVVLVGKLIGGDGRIQIPGFYDYVLPLSPVENGWYSAISQMLVDNDSKFEDAESLKARWREPSLTIHGFKTSGSGKSTIIPHIASATLSLRLVPNQDAETMLGKLRKFLYEQFKALGSTNELTIPKTHPVDPWLGDPNNQIFRTLEEAVIEVWGLRAGETRDRAEHESRNSTAVTPSGSSSSSNLGREKPRRALDPGATESACVAVAADGAGSGGGGGASSRPVATSRSRFRPQKPLYIREGGSIPAIRFLEKEFGAPAAQLPCGQASDSAHLDNERLRLLNLYNSRKIFRHVFKELPKK